MDGTSSAKKDFFSLSSTSVRTTGCPSLQAARTLGCRMCLGKPCSSRTPCAYSGLATDNSPIAKPEDKMEALMAAPMTHIFFESKATKTDDKEETPPKHVFLESKVTVTPLNDDDESFCFDEISEAEILDAINEINGLEESMTAQGRE
jgi:hypothetical protein